MKVDLYTSATFYKPSLVNYDIDISEKHTINDIIINLDVDKRIIKQGNKTNLKGKPILKQILRRNSPMTINSNNYKEFMLYILEILNMEISLDNEDILNFLNIYDLDFRSIKKNMNNDTLFERLVRYALN